MKTLLCLVAAVALLVAGGCQKQETVTQGTPGDAVPESKKGVPNATPITIEPTPNTTAPPVQAGSALQGK